MTGGDSYVAEDDGGTLLEYAVDEMTTELLDEMVEVPAVDHTAYICWFCARPFIGRMSFYIHLVQEALALPGSLPCLCAVHVTNDIRGTNLCLSIPIAIVVSSFKVGVDNC